MFWLKFRSGTARGALAILLATMFSLVPAHAATFTWTGAVSTDWFTSGNWSPSGVPGAADTAVVAGTTTIANTNTTIAALNLAGGSVLGGTGALTLTGTSTFTSGGIGCTVHNNGTVNWPSTGGNITALAGSIFNNSGTFNANANATWAAFNGGTGQQFNNSGTLNANAPAGFPQFGNGANFKNTGNVHIIARSLGISDGTSSGTFNCDTGTTVLFNANPHTLTGGALFTGAGKSLISGTVSLSGSIVGGSGGGTLELAGGTLTSPVGGGTVTGSLSIAGGNLSGTVTNTGTTTWRDGSGNVNALAGSIFNSSGTFNANANATWAAFSGGTGQQFNNSGTLNANATVGFPQFGNGANFKNTGTVHAITNSLGISDGTSSGTFNCDTGATVLFNANTHTLTGGAKFTGAGKSLISGTVSLNGSIVGNSAGGTLELAGGHLTSVAGGGTATGGLSIAGGNLSGTITNTGTTTWRSGNVNVLANANFTNSGTFNANANATWAAFNGGTGQQFNNAGTLNANSVSGFPQFGNGANFKNTGTVHAITNSLGISDGTSDGIFNCDAAATVAFNANSHTLTNGAKFTGAGKSLISGTVSINGTIVGNSSAGTLELAGGHLTTVAGGGTVTGGLSFAGGTLSGTITNNGTSTWRAGSGNISVLADANFINNGVFNANANATWAAFSGGTGQQFNNAGTLNANSVSGFPQFGNGSNFKNTGTVNVLTNSLGISDGTSSGIFHCSAGATALFNANPHTLSGGAKFAGLGKSLIQANVSLNGSIVGGLAGGTLELAGGTLTTVAGGGTITGGLSVVGGAVSGTINANGTTNWTAGNVSALDGSIFNNNGTMLAASGASWAAFSGGSGQQFNNKGTLNLKAPGAVAISIPFTQTTAGILNVKIGGTSAGSGYDQLQLGTSVILGGTLNAGLLSPFQPANGNLFSVVTFPTGARGTTTFATVNAPGFTAAHTATSVDLTALGTTPPRITSFTPTTGAATTSVVITGLNFTGASSVKFNGVSATFSVNSATQITATVPAAATTGKISVATPNGIAFSATDFTVPGAVPTITSFTPTSGKVGDSVVITGTNFTGAVLVRFNATNTTFTVNSATQITAPVPIGATTGKISVTTAGGTATSTTNFTVVPAPVIFDFTPLIGGIGTSVTINGANFTGATAVKFNGVGAAFTVDSSITITATVPASATTGKVSVTTVGGTATSTANFTVAPLPIINSFSPTSGRVGTAVLISGLNFSGTTDVKFNGVSAGAAGSGFVRQSATQITAKVPVGATTGKISVTVPAGSGVSATDFTVLSGEPVILGFSPSGGSPGLAVTINGLSFTGATAVNFNGLAAVFTVNNSSTITATVPASATSGPISVTTPVGTATSTAVFTAAPKVSSFTPSSGAPGTLVTINGLNFTNSTLVKFNTAAASFSVVSATRIIAVVPSTATSGEISVASVAGTGVRAGFTVP